jgi:hypothetical protein
VEGIAALGVVLTLGEPSIEALEGERGAGSVVGKVAGAAGEAGEVARAGAAAGVAALPHAPRSVTTATHPSMEMSLLRAVRSVVLTGPSRSQSRPRGALTANQPAAPSRLLRIDPMPAPSVRCPVSVTGQ